MFNVQGRSGNQDPYINILKAKHSKPTTNIKLNGEELETIPLKSGTRQGSQLSPYLFNIVLKLLARARQQKIKGIQLGKEEIKVSLFAYNMMLYIRDHKGLPRHSTTDKQLQQSILI